MQDFERFFVVSEKDHEDFKRLDQFLCHHIPDLSRNFLKGLFDEGRIYIAIDSSSRPKKISLNKLPPINTKIAVSIPPPVDKEARPEPIHLEILFEDEHLMVINKSPGMVIHPAPGNSSGTLVNAILYHCPGIASVGDPRRPGIVHRLDKGTSGVMVIAKDQSAYEGLVKLFSEHNIERIYQALVVGKNLPVGGTLQSTIARHPTNRLKMAINVPGGKNAITHYKVLQQFSQFAHLELKLETGRTHQIRVQLTSLLKASVLNDDTYGNPKQHWQRLGPLYNRFSKDFPHPFLHARVLGFVHPLTEKTLRFEVEPPDLFREILEVASAED